MATQDSAFDNIMEVVGNDGKFQKVFNRYYTVGLACFASMAYMNIILAMNEPDHECRLPMRENFSFDVNEIRNLLLPK